MLANWTSGLWSKDGERLDELELKAGLEPRPTISVLKHYLVVAEPPGERITARIHSGVVSAWGVTVVAVSLDDVGGQSPNFGGAGIMFLVFAGDDWVVTGPERLLGGGVGVFDPDGENDMLVHSKFAAWISGLGFGPHVDAWVAKLLADGHWRLE